MGTKLLTRPRRSQMLAVIVDLAVVLACYYVVMNFRYATALDDWLSVPGGFAIFAAMAVVVHVITNWASGVYSIVSRYMSLGQAVRVAQAGIISTAVLFILVAAWPLYASASSYLVPRSVVVVGGMGALVAMIGVRFVRRIFYEMTQRPSQPAVRLLLVGAGQAADMLLREVKRTPSLSTQVVGLLDDRNELQNMSLQGSPVLGRVSDVVEVVQRHDVTQILVAIPSATAEQIVSIYRVCKPAGVPIKILPSLAELVSGTVSLRDARDLDVKDLLGRPKVETDVGAVSEDIQGRTVLVTGAGGSIGSELCRQIARFDPGRLILVDHDESSLYDLHESLQSIGFTRYSLFPTSILHTHKLEKIFALHRPQLVFHAAAYKHVPLMELSPDEAVLNNVKGLLSVTQMATRYGTARFVNISTDKAVEPCNVMGATKRVGELIVRMMAERHPETLFASVRFGNVLGSQGSVIPIFKKQIEGGGPLVITHPEMTRYFMLIEEAVQLVLQAAVLLEDERDDDSNLNMFILEMGNPVSIVDLAQRMVDFYWKDQSRSLGVEFSGLRPGEKLDERLTYPFEDTNPTSHPLIKRVVTRAEAAPHNNGHGMYFESQLRSLIQIAENHSDRRAVIAELMACLPDYAPLDQRKLEKPAVMV